MMFSVAVLNKLTKSLTLLFIYFVGKWNGAVIRSAFDKLFTAVVSYSSAVILGRLKWLSSDHLKVLVVTMKFVSGAQNFKHW